MKIRLQFIPPDSKLKTGSKRTYFPVYQNATYILPAEWSETFFTFALTPGALTRVSFKMMKFTLQLEDQIKFLQKKTI